MKKLVGILVTSLALGGTAVGTGTAIVNNNQAQEAAINEAGVEQAYDVETELDYEKGKPVYEVEFESEGYEYDYNVDAETGAVLNTERERDDDAGKKQQEATAKAETAKVETIKAENAKAETSSTDDIGEDEAKAIALKEAGVAEADATWVRVERDYDDGRLEYSVEFHVGRAEYDFEIDAKTGKILEKDIDVDDDRYDDDWDDRYDDDWDDRYDDDWDDRYDDDWDDRWDD